jgi:hypothetical protein
MYRDGISCFKGQDIRLLLLEKTELIHTVDQTVAGKTIDRETDRSTTWHRQELVG